MFALEIQDITLRNSLRRSRFRLWVKRLGVDFLDWVNWLSGSLLAPRDRVTKYGARVFVDLQQAQWATENVAQIMEPRWLTKSSKGSNCGPKKIRRETLHIFCGVDTHRRIQATFVPYHYRPNWFLCPFSTPRNGCSLTIFPTLCQKEWLKKERVHEFFMSLIQIPSRVHFRPFSASFQLYALARWLWRNRKKNKWMGKRVPVLGQHVPNWTRVKLSGTFLKLGWLLRPEDWLWLPGTDIFHLTFFPCMKPSVVHWKKEDLSLEQISLSQMIASSLSFFSSCSMYSSKFHEYWLAANLARSELCQTWRTY